MRKFHYVVGGSDVEVWVAAKWTKIYVNGRLVDWSLDTDNTVLMGSTRNGIVFKAMVVMSYNFSQIDCMLCVTNKTTGVVTKISPNLVD